MEILIDEVTVAGKTFYSVPAEGLKELGVPDSEAQALIAEATTKARGKLVSSECRRRIYDLASAETQMNMAAASALISSKTASTRTEQEKAVLAGLEAAIGWVAAMRGNVATLAADPAKDFTADENWPEVPAAAAAIAHQF